MKILIMGLPGSGKSTFAHRLVEDLTELGKSVEWFNADLLRKEYNDWDFSDHGRLRQTERMRKLADEAVLQGKIAICDFVCPTQKLRNVFSADIVIWMDTIIKSRYENTNLIFENPISYDYHITEFDGLPWTKVIADKFNV